MGVFYPQSCDLTDGDAHARALWAGYPELGPVMEVAALALDKRALGELLGAETFTLIEILVTTARCRGTGVGARMVTEIMSKWRNRDCHIQERINRSENEVHKFSYQSLFLEQSSVWRQVQARRSC